MTKINREIIVPYSAAQMYQLVDNINAYPEFLPWCSHSSEVARSTDEVEATLNLAWGGISKSFTTRNRLHPYKMIAIHLVNGPFRHLEGYWQFEALSDEACKVQFSMEFDFAGALLSMAFTPIFEPIAKQLVDAFSARAKEVYAKPVLK